MPTVEQRFLNVVAQTLHIKNDQVGDNDNIINDLGATSLDRIELICALQEEFDIIIPADDEAENKPTVKELREYVEKRIEICGGK